MRVWVAKVQRGASNRAGSCHHGAGEFDWGCQKLGTQPATDFWQDFLPGGSAIAGGPAGRLYTNQNL